MSTSPLPWSKRAVPQGVEPDGYHRIVDRDGRHVATVPYSTPTTPDAIDGHANLEHLLRAANNVEALLEACKGQVLANGHTFECICSQGKDRQMGRKPQCCCEALRSTIAKAEPEPEPKA